MAYVKGFVFQSTPVIANGRIVVRVVPGGQLRKFQSTPVIANGRISEYDAIAKSIHGFNPRPLLLTGESLRTSRYKSGWLVSIHARYC